jgi:hypothetical protein
MKENHWELSVNNNSVKNRECSQREFKEIYDTKAVCKYIKTLIGFANNKGGTLFFGIQDNPKTVVGINNDLDEADLTQKLNHHFDPEVNYRIEEQALGALKIIKIIVEESSSKPVICKKDAHSNDSKPVLREGAIYYRYRGKTEEIKFSELNTLLQERVNKAFNAIKENITLTQKIGVNNVGLLNTSDIKQKNDQQINIYVPKDSLSNMKWIKKGKFSNEESSEKASFVTASVTLKEGMTTDVSQTHPISQAELARRVEMKDYQVRAVLWKFEMLDNPEYRHSTTHGKQPQHKHTEKAVEKILSQLPITDTNRIETIKKYTQEYNDNNTHAKRPATT